MISRGILLFKRHSFSLQECCPLRQSAAEHGGSLRDQTILIVMFHTGLRTMEVCDLASGDIQIGKRSGQLTVRSGKRNKQREVPLNATCRACWIRR